jgi:serine/threonine protein kinase
MRLHVSRLQSNWAGRFFSSNGRSDIYALACVVYETLMGKPVFDGPCAAAILQKHRGARAPSLRVVKPEIPEYVEAAVHAALEKRPTDRPPSAGQFVEMLEG